MVYTPAGFIYSFGRFSSKLWRQMPIYPSANCCDRMILRYVEVGYTYDSSHMFVSVKWEEHAMHDARCAQARLSELSFYMIQEHSLCWVCACMLGAGWYILCTHST